MSAVGALQIGIFECEHPMPLDLDTDMIEHCVPHALPLDRDANMVANKINDNEYKIWQTSALSKSSLCRSFSSHHIRLDGRVGGCTTVPRIAVDTASIDVPCVSLEFVKSRPRIIREACCSEWFENSDSWFR